MPLCYSTARGWRGDVSGANVDDVFDRVETKVKGLLDENAQLREQNRVLRSNLVNCAARLEAYYGEDYPAVRDAKAALTATSQEGQHG